ncbi:hypothetical protein GBAR_LOCUS21496 [Geodia barretti]|uniref:Uncharacterized protein n=1 Tax=Geodia barretti TaxID=519541 RepID=A0AA35SZW6_GEOBA|nr:hypothetical protein GBAR_LOCUS21496 [Geodia barretti]
MVKAAAHDASFQASQYQVPDVDYSVYSKQPKNGLILGVPNCRNRALDRKSVLRHLADNQVGFVPFGHGNNGVGPRYTGPPEVHQICPVALNYYTSQFFPHKLATSNALLNDDYLMLFHHQQLRQVVACRAAAYNYYKHY